MAAATADRVFYGLEGVGQIRQAPLAANAVTFRGTMACVNAAGYHVPASDTAGLSEAKGVVEDPNDNTGGANGAVSSTIRRGARAFFGTSADANAIVQADIGRSCYVLDDQTVVKEAGTVNSIVAGEVLNVETVGGVVRITVKVGDE